MKYIITIALIFGILLGGTSILQGILGTKYPIMVVVSQSMIPTLGVGDYIIVGRANVTQLVAAPQPRGDIVVFRRSLGTVDEYIVHRAIASNGTGNGRSFVTKGDYNAVSDGAPVAGGDILGKVIAHVPLIGYFSLFIKTMEGFGFVIALMVFSFLIDYMLPPKGKDVGKFPILSLTPLLLGPVSIVSFLFLPYGHEALELLTLGGYYVSCFLIPLAFSDDDSGVMLWLYYSVLVVIPVACDLAWWVEGITPSAWWVGLAGSVPVNWFLVEASSAFGVAFGFAFGCIIPGVLILTFILVAKRRGLKPFLSIHEKLRKYNYLEK